MRPPRLRFRLRTLTVAVAVAGLALGGWAMWRRRAYCLEQLERYSQSAESWRRMAEFMEQFSGTLRRHAQENREEIRSYLDANPRLLEFWESTLRDEAEAEECDRVAAESRDNLARDLRWIRRLSRVARYPWLPLPWEPE